MASKQVLIATCVLSLAAIHLTPATAAPAAQVVTCVDLASGKERISRTDTCRPSTEAMAKWRLAKSDSLIATGNKTKTLIVCSNKESSPFTYQLIRTSCAKHMLQSLYTRSSALPAKPVITQVSSASYDSASLALASDPAANLDAPIAYYTITSSRGDVKKVNSWRELTVAVSGLRSSTLYTFTISATSVDGTSPVSESSLPVTTQVYVAPVAAATSAPLAAPAFTLSTSAETKTVNTAITGYTISSTGGTIASYAISPSAPAGTTFSSSTGLLTGTPSSTQSATAYTITATNATGSATRTFTLTVTAIVYSVGDRGPGGGIVFYVSAAPFTSAGSTCNTACKYLEVAPATWQSGGVTVENDTITVWSSNNTTLTGQDVSTAGSESLFDGEKFNWKIGQGFYNTSVMKVSGATSPAQAAVLAYAGSSSAGQWFIPSMNELNELCKYARGQATGVLTTKCNNTGTLKTGTANDLGGFRYAYWSSSESDGRNVRYQDFSSENGGQPGFQTGNHKADPTIFIRPIRAF